MEATEADFERIMRINGLGVLIGMQEAARQMIAQGGGGKIVNTASIAGKRATIATTYCASKACVVSLTQAARALAEHKITVNCFGPGFVEDSSLCEGWIRICRPAGYGKSATP